MSKRTVSERDESLAYISLADAGNKRQRSSPSLAYSQALQYKENYTTLTEALMYNASLTDPLLEDIYKVLQATDKASAGKKIPAAKIVRRRLTLLGAEGVRQEMQHYVNARERLYAEYATPEYLGPYAKDLVLDLDALDYSPVYGDDYRPGFEVYEEIRGRDLAHTIMKETELLVDESSLHVSSAAERYDAKLAKYMRAAIDEEGSLS